MVGGPILKSLWLLHIRHNKCGCVLVRAGWAENIVSGRAEWDNITFRATRIPPKEDPAAVSTGKSVIGIIVTMIRIFG